MRKATLVVSKRQPDTPAFTSFPTIAYVPEITLDIGTAQVVGYNTLRATIGSSPFGKY